MTSGKYELHDVINECSLISYLLPARHRHGFSNVKLNVAGESLTDLQSSFKLCFIAYNGPSRFAIWKKYHFYWKVALKSFQFKKAYMKKYSAVRI